MATAPTCPEASSLAGAKGLRAVSERAGVLLVRNGRVALIERHRDGEHYYVAPGGGVELGESRQDAAVREAREELGIDVRLLHVALIVESVARGRSRQYFWNAEADTEEFGPMAGPAPICGLLRARRQGSEALVHPLALGLDVLHPIGSMGFSEAALQTF